MLLAVSCRQNAPEPAPKITPSSVVESQYVGNAACAECHAEAFTAHKGSRHDLTLRPVSRESLGEIAPPTGTVPLAGYSVEEQGGKFVLARQFPEKESLPLDLVIGSGKSGMTYV